MSSFYTTRELAELLGSKTWQVRRIFEDGALPEPGRFAGKRAIPRELVADVAEELRRRGWLPETTETTA